MLIQELAMREQEVTTAIVAIRKGTLRLPDAEQQLPGLSRLIHPDGHWHTLRELKTVSRELTAAGGHPDAVSSLIDGVMTRMTGRRIGGAETSAAGEARPSASAFRTPASSSGHATGEPPPHEAPTEAAHPLIEIPEGIDLSQLGDEWWEQPHRQA